MVEKISSFADNNTQIVLMTAWNALLSKTGVDIWANLDSKSFKKQISESGVKIFNMYSNKNWNQIIQG